MTEFPPPHRERAGQIDFVLWRWLSRAGSGPGYSEVALRKIK